MTVDSKRFSAASRETLPLISEEPLLNFQTPAEKKSRFFNFFFGTHKHHFRRGHFSSRLFEVRQDTHTHAHPSTEVTGYQFKPDLELPQNSRACQNHWKTPRKPRTDSQRSRSAICSRAGQEHPPPGPPLNGPFTHEELLPSSDNYFLEVSSSSRAPAGSTWFNFSCR